MNIKPTEKSWADSPSNVILVKNASYVESMKLFMKDMGESNAQILGYATKESELHTYESDTLMMLFSNEDAHPHDNKMMTIWRFRPEMVIIEDRFKEMISTDNHERVNILDGMLDSAMHESSFAVSVEADTIEDAIKNLHDPLKEISKERFKNSVRLVYFNGKRWAITPDTIQELVGRLSRSNECKCKCSCGKNQTEIASPQNWSSDKVSLTLLTKDDSFKQSYNLLLKNIKDDESYALIIPRENSTLLTHDLDISDSHKYLLSYPQEERDDWTTHLMRCIRMVPDIIVTEDPSNELISCSSNLGEIIKNRPNHFTTRDIANIVSTGHSLVIVLEEDSVNTVITKLKEMAQKQELGISGVNFKVYAKGKQNDVTSTVLGNSQA